MLIVIFVIAILKIIYCLAALINPKLISRAIAFFLVGSRIYLIGLFYFFTGILLLFSATYIKMWGYVVTLGLFLASSGLSVFFISLRGSKKLLKRLQGQSHYVCRLYTVLVLVVWSILVSALLP